MARSRLRGRGRPPGVTARQLLSGGCLALALALGAVPAPAPAQAAPMGRVAAEVRSSAGKLKPFYQTRNYYPLWVEDGTVGPQADRLIELLETADLDGLNPRNYDPDELREIVDRARGGSPKALGEAELKLSRAFADYVGDVRRPPSVKMVYLDRELMPKSPDRVMVLRAAAVAPSLADYVADQGWMSPLYARLRAGLAEYRTDWADLPMIYIPTGPTLRAGAKGERVAMLRERLGLASGAAFDKPLVARLKAFQTAHGLPGDAIAGAKTIEALNRPPSYYEEMLRLNLERARVLPSARERHIVVDAASARLWMYEDGEVKDTMKVIVGKPTEPTPMLAGLMRYAVVNPYWNVPPDLVARRIAPKAMKGSSLKSMGFEALADWTADSRVLSTAEIDWAAVEDGRQQLRVRQLPGGTNAMGKMKFMFPNDLGIYLHDTPEKALFKKEERRFSSGCVRVEDAQRLARWLFGKTPEVASDAPEQQVALDRPVPVYITYLTAAPAETGIAFRDDPYGRDELGGERFASR